LDCPVGYSALPVGEENHDWYPVVSGGLTKKRNRRSLVSGDEPFCAPVL
jgi:hypothetical protein